jgi:hypothetical protein
VSRWLGHLTPIGYLLYIDVANHLFELIVHIINSTNLTSNRKVPRAYWIPNLII